MLPLPRRCPLTGGPIVVTRFYCPDADVSIEGRFAVETPPFAQLSPDQLKFVDSSCATKASSTVWKTNWDFPIPRFAAACTRLSARWATNRAGTSQAHQRLPQFPRPTPAADRKAVLADLDAGKISFDDAMKMLQGGD